MRIALLANLQIFFQIPKLFHSKFKKMESETFEEKLLQNLPFGQIECFFTTLPDFFLPAFDVFLLEFWKQFQKSCFVTMFSQNFAVDTQNAIFDNLAEQHSLNNRNLFVTSLKNFKKVFCSLIVCLPSKTSFWYEKWRFENHAETLAEVNRQLFAQNLKIVKKPKIFQKFCSIPQNVLLNP